VGKRRFKTFNKKRDADAFLADSLHSINKGNYVHASDSPSLEKGIEVWLAQCRSRIGIGGQDNLERATYEDYRGKVQNHILNSDYGIGDHKVSALNTAVIDDFRIKMIDPDVRGRSQANAVKTVAVLRAYLSWAQDHGLIAGNPLLGRKYRNSVREDTKISPPSHNLIKILLEACPLDKELYLRFAVLTGFRASEQRALIWRYTDLNAEAVEVRERVDKYQQVAPPKSAAGYRTVPIGPKLVGDLRDCKQKQGANLDDLVFSGKDGSYLRHDTEMKAWFEPLRNKIGAPYLRWHDLRHYAVSCWIEAGLNPKIIQTRAGHSSIQITYDRYGHLLERDKGGVEAAGIENRIYR